MKGPMMSDILRNLVVVFDGLSDDSSVQDCQKISDYVDKISLKIMQQIEDNLGIKYSLGVVAVKIVVLLF